MHALDCIVQMFCSQAIIAGVEDASDWHGLNYNIDGFRFKFNKEVCLTKYNMYIHTIMVHLELIQGKTNIKTCYPHDTKCSQQCQNSMYQQNHNDEWWHNNTLISMVCIKPIHVHSCVLIINTWVTPSCSSGTTPAMYYLVQV